GALLERGAGGRHAEPAHLADDAVVGHLVLARGLAALGAVGGAHLSAHSRARWGARGDARRRGTGADRAQPAVPRRYRARLPGLRRLVVPLAHRLTATLTGGDC